VMECSGGAELEVVLYRRRMLVMERWRFGVQFQLALLVLGC